MILVLQNSYWQGEYHLRIVSFTSFVMTKLLYLNHTNNASMNFVSPTAGGSNRIVWKEISHFCPSIWLQTQTTKTVIKDRWFQNQLVFLLVKVWQTMPSWPIYRKTNSFKLLYILKDNCFSNVSFLRIANTPQLFPQIKHSINICTNKNSFAKLHNNLQERRKKRKKRKNAMKKNV